MARDDLHERVVSSSLQPGMAAGTAYLGDDVHGQHGAPELGVAEDVLRHLRPVKGDMDIRNIGLEADALLNCGFKE